MKKWIWIGVVAVVAIFFYATYNGFVNREEGLKSAWSNVETQYQRRADLIPNLVNTVKGYAAHESGTLEAVTAARGAMSSATTPEAKMEASGQLTRALRGLLAVAEAYPDLKANTNFQQLQADLTDTENRISYARQSYNDVVMDYNNAIQTFPGNIVAGGRAPKQGFAAEEDARQAPKVSF